MPRLARICYVGMVVFVMLLIFTGHSFAKISWVKKNWKGKPVNKINRRMSDGDTPKTLATSHFSNYVTDTRSILLAPSRWQTDDWYKVTAILGGTILLYHYDQSIQQFIQANRNHITDQLAAYGKPFGDGAYTLPPLFLLYLYGSNYRDRKALDTAVLGLESFIVSGGFTQLLKIGGRRHRPSSGDPYNTWDGFGLSSENQSFPSGHSTSAFSLATIIALEYNNLAFMAYGVAALTAWSRVNDNAHWASDAFFGSAVGYFTAKSLFHFHQKKGTPEKQISFTPAWVHGAPAVMVNYRF